jgi:hypothetical protein
VPAMPLIRRDNVASKFKGVHKNKDRWEARIQGKVLGTFDTRQEAAGIYARAVSYLENQARLEAENLQAQAEAQTGSQAAHSYPTRHNRQKLKVEAEATPVEHQLPAAVYHSMPRLEMSSQAPVVRENLTNQGLPVEQDAFEIMGPYEIAQALEMPYFDNDLTIYEI